MTEIKTVRKVSIVATLNKFASQGAKNATISIPFRDVSYNTVIKAKGTFLAKNPQHKFEVSKDSANNRTLITKIE